MHACAHVTVADDGFDVWREISDEMFDNQLTVMFSSERLEQFKE